MQRSRFDVEKRLIHAGDQGRAKGRGPDPIMAGVRPLGHGILVAQAIQCCPAHGELTARRCSLGRNKKSLALDLRQEAGRGLIRELLPHCDALVENFKPGRMEAYVLRWPPQQLL